MTDKHTPERRSYPCECNWQCNGVWTLPENRFCRWSNPSKAVDMDNEARTVTSNEHTIDIGRELARQFFNKRGNHSEVHLSELDLAAVCALAAERALSLGASAHETKSDAGLLQTLEQIARNGGKGWQGDWCAKVVSDALSMPPPAATTTLERAGDRMAHELGKFGRNSDDWWAARGTGGHQLCTVCKAEKATVDPRNCPQCGPHPNESSDEHTQRRHTFSGLFG